ncbi:DUF1453 domain-containing protein [Streptomyces sp. NPDC005574]|uniref:DUF1453 domain-containing protein n=1 Tax=Streptomyces sp. NPDC005574 TaxID=3156891 RepID=UPI0033A0E678
MSGLVNTLVIVAVVALVIVRQFRTTRLDSGRRWWLVPTVLAVIALREPGVLDAHHPVASALLLGAELLIGLVTGVGWAWTSRIWAEADGGVWTRSTGSSVAVWAVGIALRVALFALGAVLGIHQHTSALLLALAGTLLVRSGIMVWRARSLERPAEAAAAYRDGTARPAWKERV